MRRKRHSALARGALSSLVGGAEPRPASRALLGSVAATVLDRALAEPGSVRLDFALFLGPAPRRWNPETLPLSEAGGMETAVWELSRQLVALGHRVRVFADCADMQGSFAGVEWLDYSRYFDLSCDVLLSRDPAAVAPGHDVRARLSLLWLDDLRHAERLTPALDRRFDGYLSLGSARPVDVRASHPYVAPSKILRLDGTGAELAAALQKQCGALLYEKRLDIVIATGPALELWNPETLQATGMGGSETMAWELSRHLVALGHRVRVFGNCLGMEGLFEGVEWLDFSRFRDLRCDILLSSRQPAAVDPLHRVDAKIRLLWVHDIHCGDSLTAERDARTDAYLCLSAWHVGCFRQYYRRINAHKILQVRNGIDFESFPPGPVEGRDPRRVIYSSCPSRGLKTVLDVWPVVRAAVPDATLHVYYGFENWERSAARDGNAEAIAAIAALKLQLARTEGVEFHGRTNPRQLAEHFRRASVWVYPVWFHETSCITAMQAQAAGLRIVSSARAALSETVADRGVLLTEDPHSEAYRAAFTAATIAALRSDPTEAERASLRAYAARHFDLPRLAVEFAALFHGLLTRRAGARG